jgi:hypothetical protein
LRLTTADRTPTLPLLGAGRRLVVVRRLLSAVGCDFRHYPI